MPEQLVVVEFVAPIPVGHRVRVLRVQHWSTPLFGGPGSWQDASDPVVVDVDTGIIYGSSVMCRHLVPNPLSFQPNSGYHLAGMTEGRVTSCVVSSYGGDQSSLYTYIGIAPEPQAYR